MNIPSISQVAVKNNYVLLITFSDGLQKSIDIFPFIKTGVSAQLRDPEYFKNVKINDGYIYWENGFDFCPVFLYYYSPPAL